MKVPIYFCLLLCHATVYGAAYDKAVYMAQQGKWNDAHSVLNKLITDMPDNADVVYDAGVAAYNLADYCQASTCFARAAQYAESDDLRVRAYFNAGNACVDEKNLEKALEYYQKALKIDERNEYVRHNHDQVKKMLEEQKQQQEQQQQNDQQQDQDQQQNNDKQQDDKKDMQYQNHGDEQDDDEKEQEQNKQQGSDKKSQGKQGNDSNSDGDNADSDQQGDTQERKQEANKKQQRDGNNKLESGANDAANQEQKEKGQQHNASPAKQQEPAQHHNASAGNEQEETKDEGNAQKVAINDPWLLNILNNQEAHDKAINKQLMEAKIRQHGGKNGQNCW